MQGVQSTPTAMNPSLRLFQSLAWRSLWAVAASADATELVPEAKQQDSVRAALKSNAARQQAEARFTLGAMVEHTARIYDRCLQAGKVAA